jgi:nucleoside-diphosphate-sugar epimerase
LGYSSLILSPQPYFSLTTVHPSVVIGPPVLVPSSPSKLNETLKPFYSILAGVSPTIPPKIGSGATSDVRDVARVHLWAYENHKVANGEKYISSSGNGPPQGIADVLRVQYPERKNIPIGEPEMGYSFKKDASGKIVEIGYLPGATPQIFGKKAVDATGTDWISFPQSVLDTAKALEGLADNS